MRFVRANGLAIHTLDQGRRDGRPIVFINTPGCDLRSWTEVADDAGDDDSSTPFALLQETAALIAGSRFEIIEAFAKCREAIHRGEIGGRAREAGRPLMDPARRSGRPTTGCRGLMARNSSPSRSWDERV